MSSTSCSDRRTARRHAHRELTAWVEHDGMLVIRGRLAPEVGAVVERALEAASDQLLRESGNTPATKGPGAEVTPTQRRADALGLLAECALAANLDRGTAGDRYQVVLHVDAEALKAMPPSFSGEAADTGQAVLEAESRYVRGNGPSPRLRRLSRDDAGWTQPGRARCRTKDAHDSSSNPPRMGGA